MSRDDTKERVDREHVGRHQLEQEAKEFEESLAINFPDRKARTSISTMFERSARRTGVGVSEAAMGPGPSGVRGHHSREILCPDDADHMRLVLSNAVRRTPLAWR